MDMKETQGDIIVEVCQPEPLTDYEKSVFGPCFKSRGLAPEMLDIMTNIPNRTRIVKARSKKGALLGLTSVLFTPSIFMKHCFGQGNHIGTNNTFFFAETDRKAEVLSAIFKKLTELRAFGCYVGFIDNDIHEDFRSALDEVPHLVATKVMETGSISAKNSGSEEALFQEHKHLSRQVNRFINQGGTVHFHEGSVNGDLADNFVACCTDSYRKNFHPGRSINIDAYGNHVRDFLTNFPRTLHIYAKLNGKVVGVQTFIRHENHLELTEGGFLASEKTCHAYENIIVASVRYAEEHGIDKVSYGLILNPAKERLMDKDTRMPVFLVMFFRHKMAATFLRPYRHMAHERFPMPYWKEPSGLHLPI